MSLLITINGKSGSTNQSVYTVAQINKMAKALVGKKGKVFAVTINFDEMTGNTRLLASYATGPNSQTFESMAI